MATNWKIENPKKKVVCFDPQNKFKDLGDYFITMYDDSWKQKLTELRDCLLILDDYRMLHDKNVTDKSLMILLHMRCEWNVDIIYITHSPSLVLNSLAYYTSHYFIFYTKAQLGTFKAKIPDYIMCQHASDAMNLYVKTVGNRGEYPNFYYAVVDSERESISVENVNEALFRKCFEATSPDKEK